MKQTVCDLPNSGTLCLWRMAEKATCDLVVWLLRQSYEHRMEARSSDTAALLANLQMTRLLSSSPRSSPRSPQRLDATFMDAAISLEDS